MSGTIAIEHRLNEGFFYDEGGRRLGELTYRRLDATTVLADHTWVDGSLRGKGIARKLLDALVAWARTSGTTIVPVCSYVVRERERDPSLADVFTA